jgi:hypothetical protein
VDYITVGPVVRISPAPLAVARVDLASAAQPMRIAFLTPIRPIVAITQLPDLGFLFCSLSARCPFDVRCPGRVRSLLCAKTGLGGEPPENRKWPFAKRHGDC